jgi:threonyl-tRNA synthetase
VVGEQEVKNGTVNVRNRENVVEGEMKVDEFVEHLKRLRSEYK